MVATIVIAPLEEGERKRFGLRLEPIRFMLEIA